MKAYSMIHRECPFCGTPRTAPGSGGGVRELKQVDGDLTLLDASTLSKMRAVTELETPEQKASQTVFASGGKSGLAAGAAALQSQKIEAQQALQQALDLWAGHRVVMGDTVDEAYRRFFLATGKTVFDVQHRDLTRADYEKTTELVMSWINNVHDAA